MLATRGCLPFRRVEGNTQSPAWEYVVFCFQRRMKSASNGWSGTGPFDALLFGKPTWPHVQVRRTWIIPSAKLTSCHCKPKHSDIRRPVPAAKSVRVRSGSRRLHTFLIESRAFVALGRCIPEPVPGNGVVGAQRKR